MDAFNCYLGGNVEPVLVTGHPPGTGPAAFFMAAHITRTHDVLCPAKRTSRYSVLTWPK